MIGIILTVGACIILGPGQARPDLPVNRTGHGAHHWVQSVFPATAARVRSSYGLFPFPSGGPARPLDTNKGLAVILIHGLDEPGRVWMNLAPALAAKGYRVWRFQYPNDQAIEGSARFFFNTLKQVRPQGPLALIGHSMGGLLARQALTDPELGYAAAARSGQVPFITRLIMVGTPNHGSGLARFRLVMEIREQAINLFTGEGPLLQGFFDGAGEAGPELLPGSAFLARLNARPHPQGIAMDVIAGVLHPWLPEGDGLVMAESARLPGIPFYKVPGSHLTMIRNFLLSSRQEPPAVPLILYLLAGPE